MEKNNGYPVNNNFDWINKIGWNYKTTELKTTCVAMSEKWCGFYAHSSKNNNYNEALEAFLRLLVNDKTIDIQKPNPTRWKDKNYMVPDG